MISLGNPRKSVLINQDACIIQEWQYFLSLDIEHGNFAVEGLLLGRILVALVLRQHLLDLVDRAPLLVGGIREQVFDRLLPARVVQPEHDRGTLAQQLPELLDLLGRDGLSPRGMLLAPRDESTSISQSLVDPLEKPDGVWEQEPAFVGHVMIMKTMIDNLIAQKK